MRNKFTLAAVLSATLECASPNMESQTEKNANKDRPAEVRRLSDFKDEVIQRRSFLTRFERMMASEEEKRKEMLGKIASTFRDFICRLVLEGAKA